MNYTKLFSVEGKKVVVTGGCGYLGREIVKGFAENGANVYVLDYNVSNTINVPDKIGKHIHYQNLLRCMRVQE